MKKIIFVLIGIILAVSCSDDSPAEDNAPVVAQDVFIRAADMSFLPEIEADGKQFYNAGQAQDALLTLKNAGVNTIRVRLWKNPATVHSGFAEVKAFAQRIKQSGMKVWLTVHYSDIWADPSAQAVPAEWQNLSLANLTVAAKEYTATILNEIKPDIIQIGNETNTGFMYPLGNLSTNEANYIQLLSGISTTIRQDSPNTKIMLHHAGITGADWYFNKTANIDYDYIGLSYYPVWHGKDMNALKNTMNSLAAAHNKEVIIAETSYPFTLGYNDFTNNIIGSENQIIPAYPATPQGQKEFLLALRNVVQTSNRGVGFCYWGGEWIAFKGNEATNGSSYENQALWSFTSNALPALDAFKKEL